MAIRKNQSTLTDDEKKQFVDAILALKQSPSMLHSGAKNYSRYDDYVELHIKSMMAMPDGWAHRGPAFFPWHRVLLLQFERDLQRAVNNPNLGIPYWDWVATPAFPAFLGGDGNADKEYEVTDGPFTRDTWTFNVVDSPGDVTYLQRRFGWGGLDKNDQPVEMTLPDVAAQDTALGIPWYDNVPWDFTSPTASSFRQSAELLHNRVHRWVGGFWLSDGNLMGGTMLQMSSPNDPVFWLHHCNLDRLWSAWQARHSLPPDGISAAFLPQGGAAPGHNLHDTLIFGDHMPWIDMYTPAMVTDTYALGYSYDDLQRISTEPAVRALVEPLPAIGGAKRDPRRLFPLSSDL
jgi:tyrosinase